MTDTFVELYPDIVQERMLGPVTGLGETRYALHWLDENPSRRPGLTLTENELVAAVDRTNSEDMNEYQKARTLLFHLGYTITDPEPTSSQQMFADLEELTGDGFLLHGRHLEKIARHLTGLGWTKAAGGDGGE